MTMTEKPRSVFQILIDPQVGWFFVGKIASTIGMFTQSIAAAILIFDLTGSALWVGFTSMAQYLATVVLAIWTGALADRLDRRVLLIWARTVAGLLMFFLATMSFMGVLDPDRGPPIVVGVFVALGVTMAVSLPAMQSIVPGLVAPKDLEPAIALSSVAPSIARMVGPAVGASLLVIGGPGIAFAAAGVTHLMLVASLISLKVRQAQPKVERPDLFGGIKFVLAQRHLLNLLLGVALLGVGADTVVTLTPSAAQALGGGAELVGLLASSFGGGAVVVMVAMRPLRRVFTLRQISVGSYVIGSLGLVVSAMADHTATLATGMALTGGGFMGAQVVLNTRVQKNLPEVLRGRVMALWAVAFAGARPIAAVVNGAIADAWSVHAAFWVAAAVMVTGIPLVAVRAKSQPT